LTAADFFLPWPGLTIFLLRAFKDMADQHRMEQVLYDQIKGEPGDLDRLFAGRPGAWMKIRAIS